ncbi:MAG TPA: lactonase family protein [Bryobacteraceae bacterium]|nr:lactonase family protein [Bryobacteraceae bacterium]
MKRFRPFSLLLAALCVLPLLPVRARAAEYFVYVGTYTRDKSKGIYVSRLNTATGKVDEFQLAGEIGNPSWVTLHPSGKYLYAVTESGSQGRRGGSVSAFSIDRATGKLTALNTVSTKGSGPCHLAVDHTGKVLVAANYNSGSTTAFPIHEDGSLGEASSFIQHQGSGPDSKRQQGPHAHCTTVSPDNRFVLVNDLGLDEVLIYKLDAAKASLTPNDPPYGKVPPGAGPRHLAFAPNGKFAYVVNEMQYSTTAFAWDAARGALTALQTISDLPQGADATGNTGAEIAVHPNGRFVYSSNRGHNSLAVFSVDSKKGTLTPVEYASTQGKTPRGFGIDPTGSYLLAGNQDSDTVVVFRIDKRTGKLTPTGQVLQVGMPVCVQFLAVR